MEDPNRIFGVRAVQFTLTPSQAQTSFRLPPPVPPVTRILLRTGSHHIMCWFLPVGLTFKPWNVQASAELSQAHVSELLTLPPNSTTTLCTGSHVKATLARATGAKSADGVNPSGFDQL